MKITRGYLRRLIKEELNLLNEAPHTVVPGDTMYGIARNHGVSISALLDANRQFDAEKLGDFVKNVSRPDPSLDRVTNKAGTRNPNWIYPNEIIQIPGAAAADTGGGFPGTGGIGRAVSVTGPTVRGSAAVRAVAAETLDQCTLDTLELLDRIAEFIEELKVEYETGEVATP